MSSIRRQLDNLENSDNDVFTKLGAINLAHAKVIESTQFWHHLRHSQIQMTSYNDGFTKMRAITF